MNAMVQRNFGLTPSSRGNLAGPTLEAQSFIREEADFIAGIFPGLVLAAGPALVALMVLFYL